MELGLADPDHGYTNIHYELVVIRTYASCTKLRWTTRSVPHAVSTRYNIHVLLQEQWIVEWWADLDPCDHEDSYNYLLQVSFFEEHMHICVCVCVCVCRAVVTGRVGWVSTRPLLEAATTFLPIFTNLAACPADRLAATWPQLTELEIDGFKYFESNAF